MCINSHEVANEFLDIAPLVMRLMAADLRQTKDALNPAYFRLLALLSVEPCTLGELAERQMVSKPTMSNTITTLEERGWVARKRGSQDRRMVLVRITPAGQAVLDGVQEQMVRRVAQILEPLTEDERRVLLSGLNILRQVFELAILNQQAYSK
jgi:DNA-binding MarR family transcriptional regulator